MALLGAYISIDGATDVSKAERLAQQAAVEANRAEQRAIDAANSASSAVLLAWELRLRNDVDDIQEAHPIKYRCRPLERCGLYWLKYYQALLQLTNSLQLTKNKAIELPVLYEEICDFLFPQLWALPSGARGMFYDKALASMNMARVQYEQLCPDPFQHADPKNS